MMEPLALGTISGCCGLQDCCAVGCPKDPIPFSSRTALHLGRAMTPPPCTGASVPRHEPRTPGFSWQDHVAQEACPPADHGTVQAMLMDSEDQTRRQTSGASTHSVKQDTGQMEGRFFSTRVGRRGEQGALNNLASQTHTIKAFFISLIQLWQFKNWSIANRNIYCCLI